MLPLAQAAAQAQGDAAAGKAIWDGPNTQCKNCHGANGEGAFGPDLAGRKLRWRSSLTRSPAVGHHAGLHREPGERRRAYQHGGLFRLPAGGRAAR